MEPPIADKEVDLHACHQRLARNLEALRAIGSDLPGRLSALRAEETLTLEPTPAGPTARVRCEDGACVLLASRRDARAEAGRWMESLEDLDDTRHAVAVIGAGLGYHVAELLARRKGGLVVVLEPSLAVMQAALLCQDFARELLVRRLVLLVPDQRADLFTALGGHNVELMLGTLLVQHPASGRAFPTACGQIQRMFTEYTHYVRSALVTTLEISATSVDNVLQNLPSYLGWPGVESLKDSARGQPAVCVAAGPSLRRNMHLLGALKGRAVLLAVQTVLKPLLAAGIRPDFVTALDFSPISGRFYEGLGALDDVTLLADPKVAPVVPDSFPGPRRLFHNDFAAAVLEEMGERRDALPAGSTVAHLNLYLARYMGCDPIILVGQDLGFGENVYYAPGNPIHTTWSAELNRFNTLEMMEWQRIARMGQGLRTVPGQAGHAIYTDAQMFTYLQQFERDIAGTSAKVINATEGGARLAGAVEMPLAEAIRRHCPPDQTLAGPPARPREDAAARRDEAVACLRRRLEELDRMEEVCRNVLVPLREMPDALNDPPRFNRLHAKMDTWRRKIDSLQRIYRLVAEVAQLAEMKRFSLDQQRGRRELDPIAERREQLARDIQYVSLLREGAALLRGSIHRAIERLEGARP